MSEADIVLHVSDKGDDSNEGSREKPLWSVAAALNRVRWKSYRAATFVIHGSVTEIPAHKAMIDITGRGLPAISLRGESAEEPGTLNAKELYTRVIYVSDRNTLYLEDNITVCGGIARGACGAGLSLENGTVIMRGGEISGNDSGFGLGGGVYAGKGSEFTMEGGLITKNSTMMHGGGVFPDEGGIFTMSGGIISDNTAFLGGGGVFVGIGSDFEMTGGSIDGNKSGSDKTMLLGGVPVPLGQGGGVYINPGTSFRMKGGEIINNRAISVQEDDPGAGSGGGVFVERGGVFYFEEGTIDKNGVMNWGGGVYIRGSLITSRDSVISSNVARLGGGGVHIAGEGADFTMKGGCLVNNFCAGNGGGINILAQGSFTMESGVIVENEAYKLGNALAIEGRALVQGGLILGAADTGKGKDTKTTKGSPDNHATKAKEKGAAKPPSNGAEKPGSVGIFIGEKGKLTLLGGEVDGTMIMPDISHFEDQRKPEPQKSTST